VAAADTLVLKAGTKIIRDNDTANDVIKGSYGLEVQGGYEVSSGKLTLGSMGATNISSFGPMTQTIAGNSEETIANSDIIFGNVNAKMIKALLGKIVLEVVDGFITGGIQLNVGTGGLAGSISIGQLGMIDIKSNMSTVSIDAPAMVTMSTKGKAEVSGTLMATLSSEGISQIEGKLVTVAGTDSPALLAKDFLKIFAEHNHPSSVGPTGPLHPTFASKLLKTMSKKVFLGA